MADFGMEKLSIRADGYQHKLENSLAHFHKEKADVEKRLQVINEQIERHKGSLELIGEFIATMLEIRKADEKELEMRKLEMAKRDKDTVERRNAKPKKKQ